MLEHIDGESLKRMGCQDAPQNIRENVNGDAAAKCAQEMKSRQHARRERALWYMMYHTADPAFIELAARQRPMSPLVGNVPMEHSVPTPKVIATLGKIAGFT
ncbi:MAG TPA: hypothetical protein VHV08_06085 [Pirellulales bacterium]|nr:hypothetical protein [Pirellulales bacterium]